MSKRNIMFDYPVFVFLKYIFSHCAVVREGSRNRTNL